MNIRICFEARRLALCALLATAVPGGAVLHAAEIGAGIVPGSVTSVDSNNNQVLVTCAGAKVRLEFCTASIVRVSLAGSTEDFAPNESNLVVRYDWPLVARQVKETPEQYNISTEAMVVELQKKPLQLSFYNKGKERLLTRTLLKNGLELAEPSRRVCRMELDAGGKTEHFFGLGMQFWRCDLRGSERRVAMAANYSAREEGMGETHYVNPFLLSTAGYGIYLHTAAASRFDLGHSSPKMYSFSPDMGGLDFYFFTGPEFAPIIRAFNELCGKPTMPPRYALGLAYRGAEKDGSGEKLMAAVQKYRRAGVPLDIAGTEPSWQTSRGSHVWSPDYVKNPTAWIGDLRKLGVQVNLWERDEYVSGRMPDYAGVEPHLGKGKTQSVPDLTLQAAREAWFAGARAVAFDRGAQGFKVDENEHWTPNPGATMPSGLPQEMYANLHPTWVQRAYVEGCRTAFNQRYFGWSRGGFTGAQRYPVPGYTDASDFCDYIRATVNMGFWGAYFCPEYRYTGDRPQQRIQMMFFSPYALDNEWTTGAVPAVTKTGAANPLYQTYARLRYRLIPYYYSAFWQQHRTGLPVVRHTLTEFPRDDRAWRQDLQYFLGRDLLVAPLYENPRQVYLPEGTWIDFWSGERVVGGRSLVWQTTDKNLPLFIRPGAIIPLQPDMDFVDQKPVDPLTLLVTPGVSPAGGTVLYEDDGISYDFEGGAYAETPLSLSMPTAKDLRLTIGPTRAPGTFKPKRQMVVVQALLPGGAAEATVDGRGLTRLDAQAQAVADREGFWSTAERNGTAWVRVRAKDAETTIAIRGTAPLQDQEAYRKAYAAEVDGAQKRLAALRAQPKTQAGTLAILTTALAEAGKLAQTPVGLPQALARLNAVGDALSDLAPASSSQRRVAVDGLTLKNGNATAGTGDPKKDYLVRHDGADSSNEARTLLAFNLADLPEAPTSVHLALTCLDAGVPLPGHDAIHLMMYALNTDPDLTKATWENTPLDPARLVPVIDFFPAKGKTQELDVTAVVKQALAAKRTRITFVLDSLDDMAKGRPLVIAGPRHFENKSVQPALIFRSGK
jgi:alpha-glucosidase